MKLQVTITGDQEVMALLKRTKDGLIDLRVPMRDISLYLKRYYSGVSFVSRGSVYGERWPGLSAAYESQKAKKWGQRPMLIASGKMQMSFDDKVGKDYVKITNTARSNKGFDYPSAIQSGTRRMPARTFMALNQTIEQNVNNIIDDYLTAQIQGASL